MITRKAARDKGTRWNKAIATYLVVSGWPMAEPRTKNGTKDRGDITGVAGVMIEAKNEKAPGLSGYLDEVARQTANADAKVGVAWIKRPGVTAASRGLVAMPLRSLLDLGWAGGLKGEETLQTLLADEALMPAQVDEVVLLKRRAGLPGACATTGSHFVTMLKAGGY